MFRMLLPNARMSRRLVVSERDDGIVSIPAGKPPSVLARSSATIVRDSQRPVHPLSASRQSKRHIPTQRA